MALEINLFSEDEPTELKIMEPETISEPTTSSVDSYPSPELPTKYITGHGENYPIGRLIRYIKGIEGAYVAGGVFKNIFNREKLKDIDIFFESHAHWSKATLLYQERYGDPVYENSRVTAFFDKEADVRVELIGAELSEEDDSWIESTGEDPRIYGKPQDVIEQFDFTITKFALYERPLEHGMSQFECVFHPQFFEHLMLKRLVIDADLVKPLSSFERALRYTKYGYALCKDSKVELVRGIQDTDFENEAQISASFYDGMD